MEAGLKMKQRVDVYASDGEVKTMRLSRCNKMMLRKKLAVETRTDARRCVKYQQSGTPTAEEASRAKVK